VAPPGNQAANGENKPQPGASEETCLLDNPASAEGQACNQLNGVPNDSDTAVAQRRQTVEAEPK